MNSDLHLVPSRATEHKTHLGRYMGDGALLLTGAPRPALLTPHRPFFILITLICTPPSPLQG